MKLSIAWIFDHIDADYKTVNVPLLVELFNQKTAEVESFTPLTLNLKEVSVAEVIGLNNEAVVVYSAQWQQELQLPIRKDAQVGQHYLVYANRWATVQDFGCHKDHLMPAVYCPEAQQAGGWKQGIEVQDFILDVDNKSITNRPDMWSHRGFAREVAALLELPLKPLAQFLQEKKVVEYGAQAPVTHGNPFAITLKADACKRFAGLYLPTIENRPSSLRMATRLCRVDSRPIDALVDMTNYVMFDIGQPMHAYDAAKLPARTIVPRLAHAQEKLLLLDGQELTLTAQDLVITDGQSPIALAGVMGGMHSSVTSTTKELFLESATFDATTVRQDATRHKVRTEGSARFEKSLDTHANVDGILRYLKLLDDLGIAYVAAPEIASCGVLAPEIVLAVEHRYLEDRLGVQLSGDFVRTTLDRLGFVVQSENDNIYSITVPTFRSTKDVTIKEDILEEVGRFYGYTRIKPELPSKRLVPSHLHEVTTLRTIKQIMAYALQMRELWNYALLDEEYIRELGWEPEHYLSVKNPVSQHRRRLLTSLMPHLFKAITENAVYHDQLRFFEWGRTWSVINGTVIEKKVLAGILYDHHNELDFFAIKELLLRLLNALDLPVTWHRVDAPTQPWFMPHQTAELRHGDVVIGIVGRVNPLMMNAIAEGDAFVFEFDGDYLLQYKHGLKKYVGASKYPEVVRDVSALVPLKYTVQELTGVIAQIDPLIKSVVLIDVFTKPEWVDQRSLAFRFVLQHPEKTLTKEEVDVVWERVAESLKKLGATIR